MLLIGLSLFTKSQLLSIFHLRKYYVVRSWEMEKDVLLALVFHVFITTSRVVSTSIASQAPLIFKTGPFLLEKNMANKC